MIKILIVSATIFEVAPLKTFLIENYTQISDTQFKNSIYEVTFCYSGIGMMRTAHQVTMAILDHQPNLILQLGIAGVYQKDIVLGSLIFIDKELNADLGAIDSDDTFLNLIDLGLADNHQHTIEELMYTNSLLDNPYSEWVKELPFATSLSVNCVMGNETYDHRIKAAIVAENMEGAALHYVANELNIPYLQIRALSNYVEKRDKSRWKMKDAIINLNEWAIQKLSSLNIKKIIK